MMTLGNMRSVGVRRLDLTCRRCGRRRLVCADHLPDHEPVPQLGARARCADCGGLGAESRVVSQFEISCAVTANALKPAIGRGVTLGLQFADCGH
jgi:hypothetical protein